MDVPGMDSQAEFGHAALMAENRALRELTDNAGAVVDEQREVLRTGVETAKCIDDTGVRHRAWTAIAPFSALHAIFPLPGKAESFRSDASGRNALPSGDTGMCFQ